MSPVHEPASAPPTAGPTARPAPTPGPGMTRTPHTFLDRFRSEFFELVDAIVQSSAVLLADARDTEHDQFAKDLDAIHTFGQRLREMAHEFFDLGAGDDPAPQQLEKRLRHDMLNALNVIKNYCEEWIEDFAHAFVEAFLPGLQQLH